MKPNRIEPVAIEQPQVAPEDDPTCATFYCRMGISQWVQGDNDAAVHSFEKALELDPADVETLIYFGETRFARHEFEQAMALYRSAASLPASHTLSAADIERRVTAMRVHSDSRAVVGVHTLLRHGHVTMYLYSIQSLVRYSGLACSFHVYDDGTLTAQDVRLLREQIDGVRVIGEAEYAEADALRLLPYSSLFLRDHVFAKKLLGVVLNATTDRIMLLDADVLFFRCPLEIVDWAHERTSSSLFNADSRMDSTSLTEAELEDLGLRKVPYFNAGLVCLDRKLVDLARIERVLAQLYNRLEHSDGWIWEQTVWAALVSQSPWCVLPSSYSFINDVESLTSRCDIGITVSRHYAHPKPLFFAEGVDYLARSGTLPGA
jgi:tetratricopeptide (TPR) repeat protein